MADHRKKRQKVPEEKKDLIKRILSLKNNQSKSTENLVKVVDSKKTPGKWRSTSDILLKALTNVSQSSFENPVFDADSLPSAPATPKAR